MNPTELMFEPGFRPRSNIDALKGEACDPFNSSYVTRLHVRYTQEKFPEDLEFRIVGQDFDDFTEAAAIFEKVSSLNIFQGRYVIRRPKGPASSISYSASPTYEPPLLWIRG